MNYSPICLGIVAIWVTGCSFQRYRPQPLLPQRTLAAQRERRLDNPHLRAYLQRTLNQSRADAHPDSGWDITRLTIAAFYYHPDLDLVRAQLAVEQGSLITARQRPNPRVGLTVGYNYTPGEVPLSPWLITPSLDFLIETAGKRRARVRQAQYRIEAARLQVGLVAWQVRSRLRTALIDYQIARQERTLLQREVTLRQEQADSLQTLFSFGEIALSDMELARINLNEARLRFQTLEGVLIERQALLAASLGLPVTALAGQRITYPVLDSFPPPAQLPIPVVVGELVINNLVIRRAVLDYAVAEAGLQLEVARQYPDLQIGSSLRLYQGQRRWQLNPGLELPLFHHNQGPVAEATARRTMLGAAFLQLQATTLTQLERVLSLYQANWQEYQTARTLVSTSEARLRAVTDLVSGRELTYIDLLSARLETLLAQSGVLRALGRLQATLGELESLVQKPLENPVGPLPNLEENPRLTPASTQAPINP